MVFWRSMKKLVIFVVVFTLMYIWKKYIKHIKPGMHWLMMEGSCLPRSPCFLSPVLLKLVFSNLRDLFDPVTSEIPHNHGLENNWLNQDTEMDGLHLGLVFASHFVLLLGSRDTSTNRKKPQQKGTGEDRVSEEQALTACQRCPHPLVSSRGKDSPFKLIRCFSCMWYILIHTPHTDISGNAKTHYLLSFWGKQLEKLLYQAARHSLLNSMPPVLSSLNRTEPLKSITMEATTLHLLSLRHTERQTDRTQWKQKPESTRLSELLS